MCRGLKYRVKINCNVIGDLEKMEDRESQRKIVYLEKNKTTRTTASYTVTTKSSVKRNVLMLSTTNPILGAMKDDGKSKSTFMILLKVERTLSIRRW